MNAWNTKKIQNGNETKRTKYTYLFLSILICLIIRIFIFFLLNILEGSTYEYLNKLINVDMNIQHIKYDESREFKENIYNIKKKEKYMENINDEDRKNKNNVFIINDYDYYKIDNKMIKSNMYIKELELYFQKNKRYNNLRSFLLKNDYMYYSFNTDIYNLKYLYDSYMLRILRKDIYSSVTLRINPIFLKILHFLLFKPIKTNIYILIKIFNNYEFRFFLFISLIDILIAILLFLIIEKLNNWNTYFHYIISKNYTTHHFNIINPLLLINIYLNNPLNILSNSFLSLDNFKLLIITTSFYITLSRIHNVSDKQNHNVYENKYKRIYSFLNLLLILFHNAILLYITSFHFILVVIGINHFIIYIEEDFIKRYHINQNVHFYKLAHMLFKNLFLLLITLIIYGLFIVISYFQNGYSLSFLNNTVINEYKILLLLPNLGNFWYIFSTMFRDYYYSFLFLFHFHIFLYPVPLFFRLVKTPLIYLKVLIAIALVFQPNITINDIVYSLLLLVIDYERTIYSIPFIKLLLILLSNLCLYFVTLNLWLRKNTGNANYVFFNQLVVFNITTFFIINSMKFYIRVQTPKSQLNEGKCISILNIKKSKFNFLQLFKKNLS
ncbi:GPI transamidase subunit PIG-U, putative [Plasmodium sp. gorilla clade G3]|nr:GPI transamidase subunit PIG-U, putative [Plasmodium sp. gorilla clade G3]